MQISGRTPTLTFLVTVAGTLALTGCAALPTRYANDDRPVQFAAESNWILASGHWTDEAKNPDGWVLAGDHRTLREAEGFATYAVGTELRALLGGRPQNLYEINADLKPDMADDRAALCKLLREQSTAKYLAVVYSSCVEGFNIGSSSAWVNLRLEIWDIPTATLAFTADERAKRSTPVLWVYHYWDTAGDVTPIGRDDIRAAAERLAAAFEESGATKTPLATPQATARAMELQAR